MHQPQDDVRVMLDPSGHVFCLFADPLERPRNPADPGRPGPARRSRGAPTPRSGSRAGSRGWSAPRPAGSRRRRGVGIGRVSASSSSVARCARTWSCLAFRAARTSSRSGRRSGSSPNSAGVERRRQAERVVRRGLAEDRPAEPRVVHEEQVAQGLHGRPLAADPLVPQLLGQARTRARVGSQNASTTSSAAIAPAMSVGRSATRSGCRRSSSASTSGTTSTPFTVRFFT